VSVLCHLLGVFGDCKEAPSIGTTFKSIIRLTNTMRSKNDGPLSRSLRRTKGRRNGKALSLVLLPNDRTRDVGSSSRSRKCQEILQGEVIFPPGKVEDQILRSDSDRNFG
jgi:hypothetical protein